MKNRTLIVVLIALVIVAAVFASFGLYLLPGQTPQVVLPTTGPSGGEQTVSPTAPGDGEYLPVEVTPETVQSVIATLSRADSYTRSLTIRDFWGEESSATAVSVWVDNGFIRVQTHLNSGRTQNTLMDGETLYLWYDQERDFLSFDMDERTPDLVQRFPTYEDVLEADPDTIVDAGYAAYESWNCVYVEVEDQELNYLYRYWVDISSGLLVASETVEAGQVVYRMTSTALQSPCPVTASFRLPDGTVLHQVG